MVAVEDGMKRDLKFEAVYPYTPEQVWKALTDPQALADWLLSNDFEPRLGHKFQFRSNTGSDLTGVIDCEIVELNPPKRLSYAWRGGNQDTVVSFTLQPVAKGTLLVLEHSGFVLTEGTMATNIMSSGWEKKIKTTLPHVIAVMVEGPAASGAWSGSPGITDLLARYERGGTALDEALRTLPASELDRQAQAGTWNVRQIALHVVDAEIVGAARLRMLAAQPGALLKSCKGDIWGEKLGYAHLSLEPALALFRALRQTTAEVLHGLPREAWMNRGIHEETGEVTLEDLLQAHCQHTESHIEEIAALSGTLAREA